MDGITWLNHDNGRIYESTRDVNAVYKVNLSTPVTAIAVRINPYTWSVPPGWPLSPSIAPPCTRAEVFILNPVNISN